MTKLFVAESAWRIVDDAMRVPGGIGHNADFPIRTICRPARIPRISAGAVGAPDVSGHVLRRSARPPRIGAGADEIMKLPGGRKGLKETTG